MSNEITKALYVIFDQIKFFFHFFFADPADQARPFEMNSLNVGLPQINPELSDNPRDRSHYNEVRFLNKPPVPLCVEFCKTASMAWENLEKTFKKLVPWGEDEKQALEATLYKVRESILEGILVLWAEG